MNIPVKDISTASFVSVITPEGCNYADTKYELVDREWDERDGAVNFIGQDEVEICQKCGAQYDVFEENWV